MNFDGLPLFKSSSTQFWPILARVCDPVETDPFMIGLYCGQKKPANLDEYLGDFVEEMQNLEQGPVDVNFKDGSRAVQVRLSSFICDTPARAFVK